MEDKVLLELLEANARYDTTDLAMALNETDEGILERMSELERQKVICGYHTIINWDRTNEDVVKALIEIRAQPERKYGYDRIAEKIYRYDEVDTMYLLSGNYEFVAIIKGKTMQEVSQFVASKLAPIEGVTGTVTLFVLKQYKRAGTIFDDETEEAERLLVTP